MAAENPDRVPPDVLQVVFLDTSFTKFFSVLF